MDFKNFVMPFLNAFSVWWMLIAYFAFYLLSVYYGTPNDALLVTGIAMSVVRIFITLTRENGI